MNVYENRIIGGIVAGLVKPDAIPLGASDFESDLGSALTAAKLLHEEGSKVDAAILADRLSQSDSFYSVQDFELMARSVNSATVVFDAVEKVKSSALRTFLLNKTAEIALRDNDSASQLLEELKLVVSHAENEYRSVSDDFVMIDDVIDRVKGVLADLKNNVSYALPTGFAGIDELILDGFSKGDEHVLVGFTGSGKTALALNFALRQMKAKRMVGFVSREMSDTENLTRMLCSDSGVERWKVRKEMSDETHDLLVNHLETMFRGLPFAINTKTDVVENLRPQIKRWVESKGLEILYVDYLQLLLTEQKSNGRADAVATVSRTLKLIAMENNIPVISLCQFNRAASSASVFEILTMLKDSSSIEQDASTVSYVQIEKSSLESPNRAAELTVLKNRNGTTFKPIKLNYHGPTFTFREVVTHGG